MSLCIAQHYHCLLYYIHAKNYYGYCYCHHVNIISIVVVCIIINVSSQFESLAQEANTPHWFER